MGSRAEQAVTVRIGAQARDKDKAADPLARWRFGVDRLRDAFALFSADAPISELHARACNKGTKSETMAAYVIACAQKRRELDGVPLPRWRGKVECAQLVLDFKQQKLSVQPAYLRVLGDWPHHARRTGSILESLAVMPIGGTDDESTWSTIDFLSQENRRSGLGVRADVVAFDEPPVAEILRELRKAGHAGRRSIRIIGETPTIRSQWQSLRDEYGNPPRSSINRVNKLWAEVRWSLHEIADWILSPAEKEDLLIEYGRDRKRRDPLYDARVYGDYIDATGSCPFDIDTLLEMLAECTDPEVVEWRVTHEDDQGIPRHSQTVEVEVWHEPEQGARYFATIDPSSGVDDSQHDPYEIEITKVGSGDLVARCGGYLPGKLVGILGAGLCRQYNNALADIEVNDRWGTNVVEGYYAAKYTNFAREPRMLSPGKWSQEIGFHNTGQTRPLIIGSIQAWIDSWRAGVKYGKCPSRFVLQTLLDCILDPAGKIVGAPGVHDEALICRGQALRKCVTRSGRMMPELHVPALTKTQKLFREISTGMFEEERPVPGGLPMLKPKARPR